MSNASVPYDKLDALAGECELMEGQGLTFMPGVMGRRLRALLAEAREKLAAEPEGLREAINKRVNEFYGSGASAFSIDSREMAAKQCIADLLEIANSDAALRGEGEPPEPDPNADGPAERAHRDDEARRMK